MKCGICNKRIWFWRFRGGQPIGGGIYHNKCLDKKNETKTKI